MPLRHKAAAHTLNHLLSGNIDARPQMLSQHSDLRKEKKRRKKNAAHVASLRSTSMHLGSRIAKLFCVEAAFLY